MSIFTAVLLIFGASQLYWFWRGYWFLSARIRSRGRRVAVCGAVLGIYLLLYQFNFGVWREVGTPVRLTFRDALLAAPFLWWASSSVFAFLVVMLFAILRAIASGARWLLATVRPADPDRRFQG